MKKYLLRGFTFLAFWIVVSVAWFHLWIGNKEFPRPPDVLKQLALKYPGQWGFPEIFDGEGVLAVIYYEIWITVLIALALIWIATHMLKKRGDKKRKHD
jgi:hypothetical protein